MTRPGIIRADTIDLQSHHNPSAADHTHPNSPPSTKTGFAPSQTNALHNLKSSQAKGVVSYGTPSSGSPTDEHSIDGVSMNGGTHPNQQGYRKNETTDPNSGILGIGLMGHDRDSDDEDERTLVEGGLISGDRDANGEDADADGESDEDMLDKMSSSPSIDDEDIDFEFVYALHTFIATVEGQANASKGDTMVLLDDSNSYWWLVRVVKDSSIGYLPAEHIETPSERLARLNKHRNVDLSARMLGDDENPGGHNSGTSSGRGGMFIRAIRSGKAGGKKSVQFAPPTFVEPQYFEYSDDSEDEGAEGDYYGEEDAAEADDKKAQANGETAEARTSQEGKDATSKIATNGRQRAESPIIVDEPRTSEDSTTSTLRSKAGRSNTLKTPDSAFFTGEETKKITLTPQLFRDDGGSQTSSKDLKGRSSSEKLKRDTLSRDSPDELEPTLVRKEPPKKEKKSGGVLGLFRKKNKKKNETLGSKDDDEVDEFLNSASSSNNSLAKSAAANGMSEDKASSERSRESEESRERVEAAQVQHQPAQSSIRRVENVEDAPAVAMRVDPRDQGGASSQPTVAALQNQDSTLQRSYSPERGSQRRVNKLQKPQPANRTASPQLSQGSSFTSTSSSSTITPATIPIAAGPALLAEQERKSRETERQREIDLRAARGESVVLLDPEEEKEHGAEGLGLRNLNGTAPSRPAPTPQDAKQRQARDQLASAASKDRLSESPEHVVYDGPGSKPSQKALVANRSTPSPSEPSSSLENSPNNPQARHADGNSLSSPELIDAMASSPSSSETSGADREDHTVSPSDDASLIETTPSSRAAHSRQTSSETTGSSLKWSDHHLRLFFDPSSSSTSSSPAANRSTAEGGHPLSDDVRDMLVVVNHGVYQYDTGPGSISSAGYDDRALEASGKTGSGALGWSEKMLSEHPDLGKGYREASEHLGDITKRLDGILGEWLQRKSMRSPRPSPQPH